MFCTPGFNDVGDEFLLLDLVGVNLSDEKSVLPLFFWGREGGREGTDRRISSIVGTMGTSQPLSEIIWIALLGRREILGLFTWFVPMVWTRGGEGGGVFVTSM